MVYPRWDWAAFPQDAFSDHCLNRTSLGKCFALVYTSRANSSFQEAFVSNAAKKTLLQLVKLVSSGGAADTDGPENLWTFSLLPFRFRACQLLSNNCQRVFPVIVAYCVCRISPTPSLSLSISEPQTSRGAEGVGQSCYFEWMVSNFFKSSGWALLFVSLHQHKENLFEGWNVVVDEHDSTAQRSERCEDSFVGFFMMVGNNGKKQQASFSSWHHEGLIVQTVPF